MTHPNFRSSSSSSSKKESSLSSAPPLKSTIICLSGYTAAQKNALHQKIQSLGGTYVRDLDTTIVTHLLCPFAGKNSAKYKQAVKKRKRGGRIEILKEEWVEECKKRGKRVKEGRFRWLEEERVDDRSFSEVVDDLIQDFDNHDDNHQHDDKAQRQRQRRRRRSVIFSSCRFLLIGFENNHGESHNQETYSSLSKLIRKGMGVIYWNDDMSCCDTLTHVVVNDDFDENGDDLRNTVISFCKNHPSCPQAVSSQWVLDSFQQQALLPFYKYLPKPKPKPKPAFSNISKIRTIKPTSSIAPPPQDRIALSRSNSVQSASSSIVTSSRLNLPSQNSSLGNSSSSIFQGSVFVVLRQTPPTHAIDFNISDLVHSIQSHGGHMLSQKVIVALQRDALDNSASTQPDYERVCYVVSLGGSDALNATTTLTKASDNKSILRKNNTILQCHPLLSELAILSKKGNNNLRIRIVSVTPTWVTSCIQQKWEIPPEEYPYLFQPQDFYIHCFPKDGIVRQRRQKKKRHKQQQEAKDGVINSSLPRTKLKVALTGFVGLERIGIIHLLQSMGAIYTEDLTWENTHLICPGETSSSTGTNVDNQRKSAKFQKACEWGLFVVSIDWLHHVMQYGYHGKENRAQSLLEKGAEEMALEKNIDNGCEHAFSLSQKPKNDNNELNEQRRKVKEQKKYQNETRQSLDDTEEKDECSSSFVTPFVANSNTTFSAKSAVPDPKSPKVPIEAAAKATQEEGQGEQEHGDKELLRSALKNLESPLMSMISLTDRKSVSSSFSSKKRRDRSPTPPPPSLSLHRQKRIRRSRERAVLASTTSAVANEMNGVGGSGDEGKGDGISSKTSFPQPPEKSQEEGDGSIEYTCATSLPIPSLSLSFPNRRGVGRHNPRGANGVIAAGARVTQQDEHCGNEYEDDDNDGKMDESQVVWYPERTQQH